MLQGYTTCNVPLVHCCVYIYWGNSLDMICCYIMLLPLLQTTLSDTRQPSFKNLNLISHTKFHLPVDNIFFCNNIELRQNSRKVLSS